MTKAEQDELIKHLVMSSSSSDLRDHLASEATEHRQFLTRQLTLFIRYIGLFLIFVSIFASVGSVLFINKSLGDAQESIEKYIAEARRAVEAERQIMKAQLDNRIVDYQVREHYRERIAGYIAEYVGSDDVHLIIENKVDDYASAAARKAVTEQMADEISKRLRKELASLDESDTRVLIEGALSKTTELRAVVDAVRVEIDSMKTSLRRLDAADSALMKAHRGLSSAVARIKSPAKMSETSSPVSEPPPAPAEERGTLDPLFDEGQCYARGGVVVHEAGDRALCIRPNGEIIGEMRGHFFP